MLTEAYITRKKKYQESLRAEKQKEWKVSLLRILLFLLSAFFIYLGIEEKIHLFFAALTFGAFLYLMKKHQHIRQQIHKFRALVNINQNELDYLDNRLSVFDDGKEFIDTSHLFSNDLDLFGKNSLFAHINRCTTLSGKQKLAEEMQSFQAENILSKQKAIQELSQILDWRQQFAVSGSEIQENPNFRSKLENWQKQQGRIGWLLSPYLLYPLATLAIFLLIYWFYDTTFEHFKWFLWAFGLNFILVLTQFKKIKAEAFELEDISNSLQMYSELLLQIEKLQVQSELLNSLHSKIKTSGQPASQALKKLSRILNGFNQLNNPVAVFISNGLYHFHLNVLRQLYGWKKGNAGRIAEWMDTVAEFDKLNSIANYVYNHPAYCTALLAEDLSLNAVQMGHPLLNPNKRVDNDLSFNGYKYVLLTGSNMSGKSTFLRAIGLNLVLMKIGSSICAERFSAHTFTLLSSMRQVDSLDKDESYFQAEVLRLKRIKEVLDSGQRCFVLLDEILRGTNSDDKRRGTALFMEKIASSNSLGIIATHDIDIADLAKKQPSMFSAKYFESKVINGELVFDYTFREGICTTPNAIELMKSQGII